MKLFCLELILILLLSSCSIFQTRSIKSKTLYKKFNENKEKVIIKYSNNPETNLYWILVYKGGSLVEHIEITDIPTSLIINKLILSEKETNSTFRIVSDTTNNQLKSKDFQFPEIYCTPKVLSSFIPLSEREKILLKLFAHSLPHDSQLKLSEKDVEKFIGWVRIFY